VNYSVPQKACHGSDGSRRPPTAVAGARPDPRPVHVKFMVDKVAVGRFFSEHFSSPSVGTVPPMLRIHSFIYRR
jgi:hypothetical protein